MGSTSKVSQIYDVGIIALHFCSSLSNYVNRVTHRPQSGHEVRSVCRNAVRCGAGRPRWCVNRNPHNSDLETQLYVGPCLCYMPARFSKLFNSVSEWVRTSAGIPSLEALLWQRESPARLRDRTIRAGVWNSWLIWRRFRPSPHIESDLNAPPIPGSLWSGCYGLGIDIRAHLDYRCRSASGHNSKPKWC